MGDADLPEIPEKEATGETLRCYSDLKAALPVRTVNLIYRHLATIPGALPWAVSIVAALKQQDFLERAAQTLCATPVPSLPDLAPRYWDDHGVTELEQRRALDILRAYNWSNPRNLVVLRVMAKSLETAEVSGDHDSNSGAAGGTAELDPILPALTRAGVPLPDAAPDLAPPATAEELTPDILQLIRRTCAQLGIGPHFMPTLHRHLGIFPDLYRALSATTEAAVADGRVNASAREWEDNAARLAASNTLLISVPTPPGESRPAIRNAVALFSSNIPIHCVLGVLWERGLTT